MLKHSTENNNEPDVHKELTYIASGTSLMFVGTVFSNVVSLIFCALSNARVILKNSISYYAVYSTDCGTWALSLRVSNPITIQGMY